MAGSLKDQLVQSGLADPQRAKEVTKAKRKAQRQARNRGKQQANAPDPEREERARQVRQDRERENQRQAERQRKEITHQIRQLIERHRLDRTDAEIGYQYTCGTRIRKIRVHPEQQRRLATGELAVVAYGEGHELVPVDIAERIRQRDESAVLVVNRPDEEPPTEEDPYGDYPVPDDLMW